MICPVCKDTSDPLKVAPSEGQQSPWLQLRLEEDAWLSPMLHLNVDLLSHL